MMDLHAGSRFKSGSLSVIVFGGPTVNSRTLCKQPTDCLLSVVPFFFLHENIRTSHADNHVYGYLVSKKTVVLRRCGRDTKIGF